MSLDKYPSTSYHKSTGFKRRKEEIDMKLKDGFEVTQISKDYYTVRAVGQRAEEFPHTIQLGFSGAFLWDALTQEDCTEDELVDKLDHLFEAETPTSQLRQDVRTLVDFLKQYDLLEIQ